MFMYRVLLRIFTGVAKLGLETSKTSNVYIYIYINMILVC